MKAKQIEGTKRFFIHEDGYVFKVYKTKEYEVPINIIKGVPRVRIGNEKLNLALLMIEYFYDKKLTPFTKYSFKVVNNRLPLKNINIKTIKEESSVDDKNIFIYKCAEKASAQNTRVKFSSTITEIDVLNSLKRTNYCCEYCGDKINSKTWHIDHVQPLSKNGINSPTNITPSCKVCNLMKNSMPLEHFISQVQKIFKNRINNNL